MATRDTTNSDEERSKPLGDTSRGNPGVPTGEQGISNRAGDIDDEEAGDDDDDDGADEE